MGIGFRVTCFIDNLWTFDDVGVYKGEGFKRTSCMECFFSVKKNMSKSNTFSFHYLKKK